MMPVGILSFSARLLCLCYVCKDISEDLKGIYMKICTCMYVQIYTQATAARADCRDNRRQGERGIARAMNK